MSVLLPGPHLSAAPHPLFWMDAPPTSGTLGLVPTSYHRGCWPGAFPTSSLHVALSWAGPLPPPFHPYRSIPLKGRRSLPVPRFPTPRLPLLIAPPVTPRSSHCLLSKHSRRRVVVMSESCKAPPPTTPFGELLPRHILFLGWTVPHPLLLPLEL
jgi:hypothetical protein